MADANGLVEILKRAEKYTESQKKASLKYARENLKRVPLDLKKDEYEKLSAAANY